MTTELAVVNTEKDSTAVGTATSVISAHMTCATGVPVTGFTVTTTDARDGGGSLRAYGTSILLPYILILTLMYHR